ncbi:BglG family transcription antiterminator [Alkalibacterium iburiense]|uniref:BglG family transcription antiterminator n=1 Tax=Alkalibacterium iburiense TaxID=290589 RepID=A0ABN0XBS9_9LACT
MSSNPKSRLLKLLVESEQFEPAGEYAKKLSVSSRTLYTYLDELESALDSSTVKLEKRPGVGIRLKGKRKDKDRLMYTLNLNPFLEIEPEERQHTILKKLLNGERLSYSQLSKEYYVSRSTVVKDIKAVKETFFGEDIQRASNHEGSVIVGSEQSIQKVWSKLLRYRFEKNYHHPPINLSSYASFIKEELNLHSLISQTLVSEVERLGLKYNIADYYRINLFESFMILYYRIRLGFHHGQAEGYIFERISELETFHIANELTAFVKNKTGISCTLEDTLYVNQCLIANGISQLAETTYNQYYESLAEDMIQKIGSMLNEDLSQDPQLKRGLLNHIIPMSFRLKNDIPLQNPYIQEIKKQYSLMFHLTWYSVIDFEQEIGKKIPEDEIAFLMIHFQSALERRTNIKKVLIVSQTGTLTTELLERRIKHVLPSAHIYEIMPKEKMEHANLSKVDLIISTVPIQLESTPVLYLSTIPSDKELKELEKKASTLLISQSGLTHHPAVYEQEHPFISSLRKRFKIIKGRSETVKEAISLLVQPLENEEKVTPDYLDSVFDREEMSSTAFETGVAIPHGNPAYVNETTVSILINETKIPWGTEKVDIVILISVSKADMNYISFFIERIYEVMQSRENVERVFFNQPDSAIYRYLANYH